MDIDCEKFFEFIEKLRQVRDSVFIVEGSKDRKALQAWGIHMPIELFRGPTLAFVERIVTKYSNHTEIILMLDADPTGRKLTKELTTEFGRYKRHVNIQFWLIMQTFGITYTEGLLSHRLKDLYARYSKIQI